MRRSIVLLTAVLVAGLVGVAPASSAPSADPPNSPRINFFADAPEQFAAYQAFHVSHGWGVEKGEPAGPGDLHFYLFVDDVQVEPDFIGCLRGEKGPCRTHLFEFSEGLEPGVHTFTAMWMAPCEVWYEECVKDDVQMTRPDFVREFEIEFVDAPYVGAWVTDDGNSNTYFEIDTYGGFYLLDPVAVVCGEAPAEITSQGVFVPGNPSSYEVSGDIICPPDDQPVFSGWDGIFTYDGGTDTVTGDDGLVYYRVDGYESIRETLEVCGVNWYEAEFPDGLYTECQGVNIRNADGDYVLVLTALLPDEIKTLWLADYSPSGFDTGCLASVMFNVRDGFSEETMFFTESTRTYALDGGNLEFVEVCHYEGP